MRIPDPGPAPAHLCVTRVEAARDGGGPAIARGQGGRCRPRWSSPVVAGTDAAPELLARICVIFATRGRPQLLAETVAGLEEQTLRPAAVIVSCPTPDDAGRAATGAVHLVLGARGLAAQRNRALDAVPDDTDIVVFFDDDFIPHKEWIARVAAAFAADAGVAAVTGYVVADGIKGPGLTREAARKLLVEGRPPARSRKVKGHVPYGCNMAFRWSAIRQSRFDERLVLYGWLEDRDFGAALAWRGLRTVKIAEAIGVHLGVKAGRIPGRQLGYSQVINPLYLHRKGTMSLPAVADHLFRNLASNAGRALRPEPHIDRRGRLYGNLRALGDLIRGRLEPERAALL